MPTNPALLPPDPSVKAFYWIHRDGEDMAWEWRPALQFWRHNATEWGPKTAASHGYTFAKLPARPIPGPAALEAVYALSSEVQKLQHQAFTYFNDDIVAWRFLGEVQKIIRAALETKETT